MNSKQKTENRKANQTHSNSLILSLVCAYGKLRSYQFISNVLLMYCIQAYDRAGCITFIESLGKQMRKT